MGSVCILGGGVAGLSTALALVRRAHRPHHITVVTSIDHPPASTASRTGLLHAHTGRHGARQWKGGIAHALALRLLESIQLDQQPLSLETHRVLGQEEWELHIASTLAEDAGCRPAVASRASLDVALHSVFVTRLEQFRACQAKGRLQPHSRVFAFTGLLKLHDAGEDTGRLQRTVDEWGALGLQAWDRAAVCAALPAIHLPRPSHGLFVSTALSVDMDAYLQGLRVACGRAGVQFVHATATAVQPWRDRFDQVVVALGSETTSLPECRHVNLTALKGQTVEVEWPASQPALPFPIRGEVYAAMGLSGQVCTIGATHERRAACVHATTTAGQGELLGKACHMLPALHGVRVTGGRAGARSMPAQADGYLPLCTRVSSGVWVVAGLASKGLLYHAYLAELVAHAVCTHSTHHIPAELMRHRSPVA